MPKSKKGTIKEKKPSTSKKTKRPKRPIFKFNIHEILKTRQLEKKFLEQILGQTQEQTQEQAQEQTKEDETYQILDIEDNDKLPPKSIHFDPVNLSNYNIPFEDNSDSDLTKLCIQRLQIILIEGNELGANIHFNHLMKANWSPEFDIIQNILCKWSADLDTQTSDPSFEYQIKDYKNIRRHNFELVINFISSSILKYNKKYSVDELLTIAKYTVTIYTHLCGQMIHVLQRLFNTCIETGLQEENDASIITFGQGLYSQYNTKLFKMVVDLFLPLKGNIMKKLYSYLTFKLYNSLLGRTNNMSAFPTSITEWFVQDFVDKDFFNRQPKKILYRLIQLLEHVVIVFDLYSDENKLNEMYEFLNGMVKQPGLSDSLKLVNILDQWRFGLFRLYVNRKKVLF